ncbi:MAG: hypothetical protein DRJ10_02295 [Bacteroidetes bacterium]|nr:MAG: hypothetical protein DRJ10_02295 [Bacteroidota bacterium]
MVLNLDVVKKSEEYKIKLNAIQEKKYCEKNSKDILESFMIINGKKAKLKRCFYQFRNNIFFS